MSRPSNSKSTKSSASAQPVRDVREPLRDLLLLVAFAGALLPTNRWFTFIDDETLILAAAVKPVSATLALFRSGVGQHHHPPLYDLILHFWLVATGGALDWLRVPSVIFFVVGLWLLSRGAARLGGAASATAAIVIGALWPYGFHFGRLATWYAFTFLLVSGLTWAYLRFCDSHAPSDWRLVFLFALLLVYTNYFGWAILALVASDDWWRNRALSGTARRLAISAVILLVAYIPLWPAFSREVAQTLHPTISWRAQILNAGYNAYVLLVSESVAPWFWRFGVPATIAVAACFLLAFWNTAGPARRLLVYAALLFAVMAGMDILQTKRLLLIAPWVLLPLATALGAPAWPKTQQAFLAALVFAFGIGWYGVYARRFYAAPRFFEPWADIAADVGGNAAKGAGVIGNNPSFFFYLTYVLKAPASRQPWSFAGVLPDDVRADNVWDAEGWIAAGHPLRPQMLWIRGMPGPDTGTPMADASDWLGQHCGDRNFRYLMRDPGFEWKQRYFPQYGELPWRVEIHEYDCSRPAAAGQPAPAGQSPPAGRPSTPGARNQ